MNIRKIFGLMTRNERLKLQKATEIANLQKRMPMTVIFTREQVANYQKIATRLQNNSK